MARLFCAFQLGGLRQSVPEAEVGFVPSVAAATVDGIHIRLATGVRNHVRRKWRHELALLVCWLTQSVGFAMNGCKCESPSFLELAVLYLATVGQVGMGLILSLDPLFVAAWRMCGRRGADRGTALFDENLLEEQELTTASQSPATFTAEEYRFAQFQTLLNRILEHVDGERRLHEELFGERIASPEEHAKKLDCLYRLVEAGSLFERTLRISPRSLALQQGAPDFSFTVYSPQIFAHLQCLWCVDAGHLCDALSTALACASVNSTSTTMPSSRIALASPDGAAFMLNTVPAAEVATVRAGLPAYHRHMAAHPGSFLTRIYGLFRLRSSLGTTLHALLTAHSACGLEKSQMTVFDVRSELNANGAFSERFPSGFRLEDGAEAARSVLGDGLADGLRCDLEFLARMNFVRYSLLALVSSVTDGAASAAWKPDGSDAGSARFYRTTGREVISDDADVRQVQSRQLVRLEITDLGTDYNASLRAPGDHKRSLFQPTWTTIKSNAVQEPRAYAESVLAFVENTLFPGIADQADGGADMIAGAGSLGTSLGD
eukprot:NODE_3737_length_1993_cov_14.894427.p1 GENE.NODE_3737_length_1993_cov_14.894427~~NODE_3737_length_1993_cov_14.894427.p1  ORF type:complete len:574 (+),score=154.69 NODE_3737_length_1993_cov_14.894427:82-1722(+)